MLKIADERNIRPEKPKTLPYHFVRKHVISMRDSVAAIDPNIHKLWHNEN